MLVLDLIFVTNAITIQIRSKIRPILPRVELYHMDIFFNDYSVIAI